MNWPKREREIGYYHPTPSWVTETLLKVEKFPGTIWEPMCGQGHISEVLKAHGYDVFSSDIEDRGYGERFHFLDTKIECDHVITNPVWLDTEDIRWHFWISHALYVAKKKVAMFMPTYFWDSAIRRSFLAETPLKRMYVFKQVVFQKHALAWWVWRHGYEGRPEIVWL